MPTIELTAADWSAIRDALDYTSEDIGYDLRATRSSDFYDAEDRHRRAEQTATWDRLSALIAPLTKEVTDD